MGIQKRAIYVTTRYKNQPCSRKIGTHRATISLGQVKVNLHALMVFTAVIKDKTTSFLIFPFCVT